MPPKSGLELVVSVLDFVLKTFILQTLYNSGEQNGQNEYVNDGKEQYLRYGVVVGSCCLRYGMVGNANPRYGMVGNGRPRYGTGRKRASAVRNGMV